MKIRSNITELVGNTPIVRINKLNEGGFAEVAVKLEYFNPLSSVKTGLLLRWWKMQRKRVC